MCWAKVLGEKTKIQSSVLPLRVFRAEIIRVKCSECKTIITSVLISVWGRKKTGKKKKVKKSMLLEGIARLLQGFTKSCAWLPSLAGSPGPPGQVRVDEVTDTTAQISWQEGTDNHSPVTAYSIQARTPFSVGWQRATTGEHSSQPSPVALPLASFWAGFSFSLP